MSVHQKKDGTWYVLYRKGKNPVDPERTYEQFGKGEEARQLAVERNAELHPPQTRGDVTFSELAAAYLEAKHTSMSLTDLERNDYTLTKFILPHMGGKRAEAIKHSDLDKYVTMRHQRVKYTTIHKDLSIVRAILNWGVRNGLITSSPFTGYAMPKRDDAVVAIPTHDEYLKIVMHAAKHLQRALIIAYYTGIRPGPVELYSLKWSCYDSTAKTITITSADKGGIPLREVPTHPVLREYLDKWQQEDDNDDGYIISWKGRQVRSIKTSWKAALRRAKITKKLRPYSLRHKAITDMIAAGGDIKTVSEIVGHADPMMTMKVYQKTTPAQKRKAIDGLSSMHTIRIPDEKIVQLKPLLKRVK